MSRLLAAALLLAAASAAEAELIVRNLGRVPLPTDGVLFAVNAQLEEPIDAGNGRIAMSVGRSLSAPEAAGDLPVVDTPLLPFRLSYGESDRLGGGSVYFRIGAVDTSFVIRPQPGGATELLINPFAELTNTIMALSDLELDGEPVSSFHAARSGHSSGVLSLSGEALGTRFDLTGYVQFRYFGDPPTGGALSFQIVALGVPEPSTGVALLGGVATVALARRRR